MLCPYRKQERVKDIFRAQKENLLGKELVRFKFGQSIDYGLFEKMTMYNIKDKADHPAFRRK